MYEQDQSLLCMRQSPALSTILRSIGERKGGPVTSCSRLLTLLAPDGIFIFSESCATLQTHRLHNTVLFSNTPSLTILLPFMRHRLTPRSYRPYNERKSTFFGKEDSVKVQ